MRNIASVTRLTGKIPTIYCHFSQPYQGQKDLLSNVIDLFFCEIIEKALHGHHILKKQKKKNYIKMTWTDLKNKIGAEAVLNADIKTKEKIQKHRT